MRLREIAKREVTIELSPEDCRTLALACDDAARNDDIDYAVIQAIEACGAFFAAAALAAGAHDYMQVGDVQRCTLSAMRNGHMITPLPVTPKLSAAHSA